MRALLDVEPSRASSESDILLDIKDLLEPSQRKGLRTNYERDRVDYGFNPVLAWVTIGVTMRYSALLFSNASGTEGLLSRQK